jgi:DNA-binding LacI/PurR family transcriptional regulator
MKDIAKICGVSPAIVSRVLNNDPKLTIRSDTRESVLKTVKEIQYTPNYMASGLRTKKTGLIGLMLVDFTNPFSGQLIRGTQDALSDSGILCMACETKEQPDLGIKWIEHLYERRIDGLIIATLKEEDTTIELLEKLQIKYVMASRVAMNSSAPSVSCDTYEGMCLAMRHLIELGHTRIAYIEGHVKTGPGAQRKNAYLNTLKQFSLPFHDYYIIEANYSTESGGSAMWELLKLDKIPSAVIACNDAVAISALQAIGNANLKVPDDISIIGFHNISYSSTVNPPLTTIDTKTYEVGYKAAHMLIDLINGKELENRQEKIGVVLIRRSSTAPLSGEKTLSRPKIFK